MRRVRIAAALFAGASLLGMGSAAAVTHSNVTVTGGGATFPENMISKWRTGFKTATDVTINYAAVGSGGGRQGLIDGTYDFGASDVAANADQTGQLNNKYGGFVYVPVTAGGIAVFFRNSDVSGDLKLTGPTVAKIFDGVITDWSDPLIAADNGGTALPAKSIKVFVRSDSSGTSNVFSDYLSKAGGGAWTKGAQSIFPIPTGGVAAKGSDGVSNGVRDTEGAITYSEHSFFAERAGSLKEALIRNAAGEYRGPLAENVSAALDDATQNADGTLALNFLTADPLSYPISTTSYLMVPTRMDADKGDNMKAFLEYMLTPANQNLADSIGYAPLGTKIRTMASAQVAKINPAPATTTTTTLAPVTTVTTAAPVTTTTKPKPKAVVKAATQQNVVPQTVDPALATTGTGTDHALALAGVLLAAGGACVLAGRRRPRTNA